MSVATLDLNRAMARRVADEGRTTFTGWVIIGPAGAVNWVLMECGQADITLPMGIGWHERRPRGGGERRCEVFNRACDCELVSQLSDLLAGVGSLYDEFVLGGDDAVFERLEREYRVMWGGDPTAAGPSTSETTDRRNP